MNRKQQWLTFLKIGLVVVAGFLLMNRVFTMTEDFAIRAIATLLISFVGSSILGSLIKPYLKNSQ